MNKIYFIFMMMAIFPILLLLVIMALVPGYRPSNVVVSVLVVNVIVQILGAEIINRNLI